MLAAAVVVDLAALVAVVPVLVGRAQPLVESAVLVLAQRPVAADSHRLRASAAPLLVQVPVVLVHLVVEPAGPVQRLLSRQWFSAAMARATT
jgi:hypothetical protein